MGLRKCGRLVTVSFLLSDYFLCSPNEIECALCVCVCVCVGVLFLVGTKGIHKLFSIVIHQYVIMNECFTRFYISRFFCHRSHNCLSIVFNANMFSYTHVISMKIPCVFCLGALPARLLCTFVNATCYCGFGPHLWLWKSHYKCVSMIDGNGNDDDDKRRKHIYLFTS